MAFDEFPKLCDYDWRERQMFGTDLPVWQAHEEIGLTARYRGYVRAFRATGLEAESNAALRGLIARVRGGCKMKITRSLPGSSIRSIRNPKMRIKQDAQSKAAASHRGSRRMSRCRADSRLILGLAVFFVGHMSRKFLNSIPLSPAGMFRPP